MPQIGEPTEPEAQRTVIRPALDEIAAEAGVAHEEGQEIEVAASQVRLELKGSARTVLLGIAS